MKSIGEIGLNKTGELPSGLVGEIFEQIMTNSKSLDCYKGKLQVSLVALNIKL